MDVQIKFGEITGGRLVEGYGLTEAAPVTHCNPIYGQRKAGSIGLPLARRRRAHRRLREAGREAGRRGRRALAQGPAGDEGLLEQAGRDGEDHHRRRLAAHRRYRAQDEDGYFYIVDRLKDIIIASGFNIVPREVEEVLFQHPKVQEAVVAGVPDKYRGETVKAYVVLKPEQTCTAEEIKKFCEERLAPYKVPKQIEFRSELPKTQVGKFLRRVLVEEEKKKLEKA